MFIYNTFSYIQTPKEHIFSFLRRVTYILRYNTRNHQQVFLKILEGTYNPPFFMFNFNFCKKKLDI